MREFLSVIKEYATRDFIYFFSQKSIEMYNKQLEPSDDEIKGSMTFVLNANLPRSFYKNAQVMLSAWEIQDIAYLSIVNANDYRKKIMCEVDAGSVVNQYRKYENNYTGERYERDAKGENIFKYLVGMTYEQFNYQNLAWTFENFNRNYHILLASKSICREKIINICDVTKEIFDLNVDEFLTLELILWWLCSQDPSPLNIPEQVYKKSETSILTKENIEKLIDYYSVTYAEVRESSLKKQIFYGKPFVVTQKTKEKIAVNFYLIQMLMGDGMYWLMRDYYQNHNKGLEFLNAFGEMFEDYFEELASHFLPENSWHKIPVQKKKSADYFVEVENAVLLFELKSGLLGIGAKQQTPDVQQIDNFYNRNIKEAYGQLKESEKQYKGDKPVIKILLLYENLTNTQIIMSSMPEIFLEERRCYIMTIQDWEMLLTAYMKSKKEFNQIIDVLVNNQNSLIHYETVLNVLREQKALDNVYFENERNYFSKTMERMANELGIEMD